MPSPILIELKPSPLLIAGGLLLIGGAACTLLLAPVARPVHAAALLVLCAVGVAAIRDLLHGYAGSALSRLEWIEGEHWVLEDARGRRRAARLAPASRRLGRSTLLVFQRGVFGRHDRPWVLVLPNMVSDTAGARRLRARLTLDGAAMRGLAGS